MKTNCCVYFFLHELNSSLMNIVFVHDDDDDDDDINNSCSTTQSDFKSSQCNALLFEHILTTKITVYFVCKHSVNFYHNSWQLSLHLWYPFAWLPMMIYDQWQYLNCKIALINSHDCFQFDRNFMTKNCLYISMNIRQMHYVIECQLKCECLSCECRKLYIDFNTLCYGMCNGRTVNAILSCLHLNDKTTTIYTVE